MQGNRRDGCAPKSLHVGGLSRQGQRVLNSSRTHATSKFFYRPVGTGNRTLSQRCSLERGVHLLRERRVKRGASRPLVAQCVPQLDKRSLGNCPFFATAV